MDFVARGHSCFTNTPILFIFFYFILILGEGDDDFEGMVILQNWHDECPDPYMLFFKDGLVEEKCVSIIFLYLYNPFRGPNKILCLSAILSIGIQGGHRPEGKGNGEDTIPCREIGILVYKKIEKSGHFFICCLQQTAQKAPTFRTRVTRLGRNGFKSLYYSTYGSYILQIYCTPTDHLDMIYLFHLMVCVLDLHFTLQ